MLQYKNVVQANAVEYVQQFITDVQENKEIPEHCTVTLLPCFCIIHLCQSLTFNLNFRPTFFPHYTNDANLALVSSVRHSKAGLIISDLSHQSWYSCTSPIYGARNSSLGY